MSSRSGFILPVLRTFLTSIVQVRPCGLAHSTKIERIQQQYNFSQVLQLLNSTWKQLVSSVCSTTTSCRVTASARLQIKCLLIRCDSRISEPLQSDILSSSSVPSFRFFSPVSSLVSCSIHAFSPQVFSPQYDQDTVCHSVCSNLHAPFLQAIYPLQANIPQSIIARHPSPIPTTSTTTKTACSKSRVGFLYECICPQQLRLWSDDRFSESISRIQAEKCICARVISMSILRCWLVSSAGWSIRNCREFSLVTTRTWTLHKSQLVESSARTSERSERLANAPASRHEVSQLPCSVRCQRHDGLSSTRYWSRICIWTWW